MFNIKNTILIRIFYNIIKNLRILTKLNQIAIISINYHLWEAVAKEMNQLKKPTNMEEFQLQFKAIKLHVKYLINSKF